MSEVTAPGGMAIANPAMRPVMNEDMRER